MVRPHKADRFKGDWIFKSFIKEKATKVIGHNHDDGVAKFLRERFGL